MTHEVFEVLRNIPSLRHVPSNTLVAIMAMAAVFGFVFLFIVFHLITDAYRVEQKEHQLPDSHKLIVDLQKTLVNEMRGTSKQNERMINLTIIFIAITLIGMIVSVVGGQATVDFIRKAWSHTAHLAPKAGGSIKSVIGK